MVGSASLTGRLVPRIGTKPLFLLALAAIPLRGVLIVLLLRDSGSDGSGASGGAINGLLLATQVLDGLAGGIIGVLLVLITENLSRWVLDSFFSLPRPPLVCADTATCHKSYASLYAAGAMLCCLL